MKPVLVHRAAVYLLVIFLFPLASTAAGAAEDAESLFIQALEAYQAENYAQALELYSQSAIKGYSKSQFNLALMYYNGKGTDKNDIEAHAWLTVAAESDIEAYVEARNAVGNMLSARDQERSGDRALELVKQIKASSG